MKKAARTRLTKHPWGDSNNSKNVRQTKGDCKKTAQNPAHLSREWAGKGMHAGIMAMVYAAIGE
jgi:hypothetical protein